MAVDDEARVRAVLAEMQLRISQGPNFALGLGDAYGPEDVRSAFLALTKQFHPARFGRMSSDVRSVANEVFLGIKGAHELLLRTLGSSVKPVGSRRPTAGMQPMGADGSGRTPMARTGSIPRPTSGTAPPATQLARGTDRATGSTPPRTGVQQPSQTGSFARVTPPPAVTQPRQTGAFPRVTPPVASPASQSGPLPRVAAGQTPPPAATPTTAGLPRSATDFNPPTQRGLASQTEPTQPIARAPSTPPPATNFNVATQRGPGTIDEQSSYREALRFIQQQNWASARMTLHTLAAKFPQNTQYRALLCYTRGREAHVAGRAEEALLEYQRALQLAPDLAVAKQAAAELQRRR